jgi:hypothetical protein
VKHAQIRVTASVFGLVQQYTFGLSFSFTPNKIKEKRMKKAIILKACFMTSLLTAATQSLNLGLEGSSSSRFTFSSICAFLVADGPEPVPPSRTRTDGPEPVPPVSVMIADGPEPVPPAVLVADGPEPVPPIALAA